MSTAVVERPATIRACLFRLAGELFALDVKHTRQVVVLEDHTVVPLAPPHVIGVTNLRGYILSVLDVRPLLGLPVQGVIRGSRVLVLGSGAEQVGVAIDEVVGLEWFGEVLPLGEPSQRRYGRFGSGLLARGQQMVTLLDAAGLLGALRVEASPEPRV